MKESHGAKRKMLERLKSEMGKDDSMGLPELLKNKKMEKVTVASDSKEGLEVGLDKAKEILKKRQEMLGISPEDKEESCEESVSEEMDEIPEIEESESLSDDPQELKRQIAELKAKLASK